MTAPFTPIQERRIREIIAEGLKPLSGEQVRHLVEDYCLRPPVGVRVLPKRPEADD